MPGCSPLAAVATVPVAAIAQDAITGVVRLVTHALVEICTLMAGVAPTVRWTGDAGANLADEGLGLVLPHTATLDRDTTSADTNHSPIPLAFGDDGAALSALDARRRAGFVDRTCTVDFPDHTLTVATCAGFGENARNEQFLVHPAT